MSIYGLPDGILYGQFDRTEELNNRIFDRNKPDTTLTPNFDSRPVPTKYMYFPALDARKPSTEKLSPTIDFHTETNFNPGNKAPVNGFLSNIDIETLLRNQTKALQHGAPQNVYIPSSKSDLYIVQPPKTTTYQEQPHPTLFERSHYNTFIPGSLEQNGIGTDNFFNHTRTQLRGS
jgi:hypothetical protein